MSDTAPAPITTLTTASPLRGYQKDFGAVSLREVCPLAMVSIAVPVDGKEDLNRALEAAFQITLAAPGHSSCTPDGKTRLISLQADQAFIIFDYDGDRAVQIIADKLGTAGYYTDQSDSWVCLRLAGPLSRRALERICPLDLHKDSFVQDMAARTVMEHLGSIIVRGQADEFLLFSARSSARSFLHAIETSIRNIL